MAASLGQRLDLTEKTGLLAQDNQGSARSGSFRSGRGPKWIATQTIEGCHEALPSNACA